LTGRPSKKHGQDPYGLSITHLCGKFRGIAAEQHAEAVKWQSQFDIQGIISAARSIYISAPIAYFAKKGTQQPVFFGLALATGNRGNHHILLTSTQKQGDKKPAQSKDPGNEFLLKFVKVQGAAINYPLNNIPNNINELLLNIIDRRGCFKFNRYLGIG